MNYGNLSDGSGEIQAANKLSLFTLFVVVVYSVLFRRGSRLDDR